MKLIKFCTVLSLAAACMAFIPSQSEARDHCRSRSRGHVSVGVSAGRPYCGPSYYANPVIIRRPCPTRVVERVYVQPDCYTTREVVVVEQPYYEEVVVAPRPVFVPSFSFGLSFFR